MAAFPGNKEILPLRDHVFIIMPYCMNTNRVEFSNSIGYGETYFLTIKTYIKKIPIRKITRIAETETNGCLSSKFAKK